MYSNLIYPHPIYPPTSGPHGGGGGGPHGSGGPAPLGPTATAVAPPAHHYMYIYIYIYVYAVGKLVSPELHEPDHWRLGTVWAGPPPAEGPRPTAAAVGPGGAGPPEP